MSYVRASQLGLTALFGLRRAGLSERLLAGHFEPVHVAGMLLDPRDQFLLRTSGGPATVASHEQRVGHKWTLPLVPTGWHPDRDLGLPLEELGEELSDLRAARECGDGVG